MKKLKLITIASIISSILLLSNYTQAQVVGGFFPNWYSSTAINNLQWTKMTDLFYAFAQPTNTGGYTLTNESWLTTLVTKGKQNNVRIHLSFGGAAQGSTGWSTCISTATNRTNFANTVKNLVTTYDLNGINLDWEFPSGTEAANYADLAVKVRAALDQAEITLGHKVYLTCAVAPLIWNNDGINSTFLSVMDYVMPMAFDDGACTYCGGPNHSSLTMAQNAFLHWTTGIPGSGKAGKAVPANKIVIAIPFYDNTGTAYNSFSGSNPAAFFSDADGYYGGYYYNSDPLIKSKTDYIMPKGAAGLWTWELVQDRTDQYSLLGSMYNHVMSYSCSFNAPSLGADQSICGQSSITLNSNIATASGRTFTWKKDGVIVVNASTTATNYNVTSAGTYRVEISQGSCLKFDEIVISGTLPAVSLGGPYNLCNPTTITLNSGSDASGKTFVWKKNNIVINGATLPTYTATTAGTYNVTVSATGCSSVSGSATVNSSLPVPTNDTLCSAGTVNLTASIASDWFTVLSGGTAIKSNSTTYSSSISANTTYYIQPYGASATSYTTMRTAFQNDGWQQDPNVYATKFDALTSLTLDGVTVNTGGGDLKVNVVASDGITLVASKTFSALSAGINNLTLGFNLSAGTYYLNTVGSVSTCLVDLTPATNYSIANVLTVYGEAFWDWSAPYGDGYVLSGDYGFFANFKVTVGSSCGRVPIYAVIDVNNSKCSANPPVANFTANKTAACTGEQITFTDASTGGTATTWSWNFGTNATPATATGKGPHIVTYSTTGTKTVALTATNTFGTNTNTKTNYITVTGTASAAGTITGNNTVCSSSIQNYSIAAVSGANNYTWTVPSGATITSGQGTTAISVNFTGASSGNLSVTPSNGCGNGTASTIAITVNPLPNAAGTITGNNSICSGSTNTYSIATVTNATGYNWTVPTGTTITSGLGTNSITVTAGNTSGNITVIPSNTCGNGTSSSALITINSAPTSLTSIAGKTNVCPNQSNVAYSANTIAGATTYTWTLPSGASFVSGQGTTDVIVNFGSTGGALTVLPSNSCGNGTSVSIAISTTGTSLPFAETFETSVPPTNWTLVNTDANITWASASTGANTSSKSAFMDYWNYTATAKSDELVMPSISLSGQSTASLTFYHAYAWRDAPGTSNDRGDSLEVLISTNCGSTWTSLWKKGRTTLSTLTSSAGQNTAFVPTSAQWVLNTINLNSYVGQGSVLIKFIGRGYNGNNLYLDQINLTGSIAQTPVANFTQSTTSTCTGQNITFTDASTNVPTSWTWNFGAGANPTTATGQGPFIVTYSTAGTKTVSLTVTNSAGTNTKTLSTLVVNTTPSAAGAISGNTTVCTGVNQTYSIVSVAGATSYNWTVPSGASILSGQGTNSISVNFTNAIVGNITVTPSNTCGNGTASTLNVSVNTIPTGTATLAGASNVCQNEQNDTYSISGITGANNYAWSVPAGASIVSGNGTSSIVVNFATSGGNITVVPSNSCGSMTAISKTISITNGAADAGTITGATTVCANKTGVAYSISTVLGASGYTWTLPTGATIATGANTNNITVNFGTTAGDITVTPISACGNGLPATLTVAISTIPSAAGLITGNNTVCSGSSNTYSIATVSGATNYNWTLPSGSSITSGTGTNSITVASGANSGNIIVTPTNVCGNGSSTSQAITVNSIPANTGTISGVTTICQNQSTSYSVTSVANATNYTWTVPTGATITSVSGTNSITVLLGTSSGNVTVKASNSCGNALSASSLAVNVTNGASAAGTISGATSVCENQSSVTYSIATVNGATGYNWTVPNGASITSGANTNSITVNFASTSGNISVTPTSSCGNGTMATLSVNVKSLPIITSSITGLTSVCEGSTQNYSIASVTNATSYNWTLPTGASIITGANTNAISVDFTGSLSGQMTVSASNGTCLGNSTTATITVNGALPHVLS
ncbi:MAG: hypothetical protein RLZZ175_747 [Bacteroidota bacterium]|jgi:GH18 family chitinase/PKD repeat protein